MTGTPRPPILYRYQRRMWAASDRHRVTLINSSRQIGKTEFLVWRAITWALGTPDHPPVDVTVASMSLKTTREFMRRCGDRCRSIWRGLKPGVEEIQIPHGKRIIGVAATPNVRGFTGNLLWDEVDSTAHPFDTWRAIYPIISRKGRKAVLTTTPLCEGSFVDQLRRKGKYPYLEVDIHQAVRDGCPIDVDDVREGCEDPADFEAEYECKFIPRRGLFFDLQKVSDAMVTYTEDWPEDVGGVDVARQRDHTAFARVGTDSRRWQLYADFVKMKRQSFEVQVARAVEWARRHPAMKPIGIDDSNMSSMLAEYIAKQLEPGRIARIKASPGTQIAAMSRVKALVAGDELLLPKEHARELLTEFRRVRVTDAGSIATDRGVGAAATERHQYGGHGDVLWALAYAIEGRARWQQVKVNRRSGVVGARPARPRGIRGRRGRR